MTDTERLDWLEKMGFSTMNLRRTDNPAPGVHSWHHEDGGLMWTARWVSSEFTNARAAIDAAMQMHKREKWAGARIMKTPAGVTDHSSYELGITMERERCAKIVEGWADENWNNGMRSCWETDAAQEIAAVIRAGEGISK